MQCQIEVVKGTEFALISVMDDHDQKAQELSNQNELILKEFQEYMQKQLQVPTSESAEMLQAMRFFANEYIIHYHMEPLLLGLDYFESFVSDWFIRKCMWSNEFAVHLNGLTFLAFLKFLQFKGYELSEQVRDQVERLPSIMELALARVNAYNDAKIDVEELFDEYGCWNDEIIEKRQSGNPAKQRKASSKPAASQGALGIEHLSIHMIVSAKVAKFLKLQSPQLVKLSEWAGDGKDPSIHWFTKWRCEECFRMKGTKARVFLVTNEASRYSFLLKLEPGDWQNLQSTLHIKMMELLEEKKCEMPIRWSMHLQFFSGASASLTATQNHLIDYLDAIMDSQSLPYLDDYEKPINQYLTTIRGKYRYPVEEMEKLLKENPPWGHPPQAPSNVIPLWN